MNSDATRAGVELTWPEWSPRFAISEPVAGSGLPRAGATRVARSAESAKMAVRDMVLARVESVG